GASVSGRLSDKASGQPIPRMMVLDASGAPASSTVMSSLESFTAGSSGGSSVSIDANGGFRLQNVPPGLYAVTASFGGPDRPQDRGPAQAAFVELQVVDDDLENLIVSMRRTIEVDGGFLLEDPSAELKPRPNYGPLMVFSRPADTRLPRAAGVSSAVMRTDRTFTLGGQFGRRTFDVVNIPPGWFVKSMRLGTVDALHKTIDVRNADDRLEIVLSTRGATIDGTVRDVLDKAMPRARVLIFRATANENDRQRLAGDLISASGHFSFGPLRDGDYRIVVVRDDVPAP